MRKVVSSDVVSSLQNIIRSEEYYLSDLDWWILCSTLNLPVMLFAGTNLKNMVSEKWLFLSSTLEDIHSNMYFVRSDTVRESNHPAKYSVISPQVQVEQLQNAKKDCEGKIEIQNAIRANKLITLETFLETLPNPTIHVIRRKN